MTSNSAHRFFQALQAIVFAVAILYFGRTVLVPLIVAILLTFLLRPSVVWLERHHVGRSLSVGIVGCGVLLALGAVGWILSRQLHDFSLRLDDYQGNLKAKVAALQKMRPKFLDNFRSIVSEVEDASHKAKQSAAKSESQGTDTSSEPPRRHVNPASSLHAPENSETGEMPSDIAPQPVTIVRGSPSAIDIISRGWDLLSTPLAELMIVLVLVLFMLAEFEDLRNRVIRLAGQGKLTLTTRTLDDASKRISRYLLANALVNGGFGIIVYVGLLAIGVDYAALWGCVAATLRFIPYVGAIGSATLVVGMAVIQFEGWVRPALVGGLFVTLELITGNLIEPVTYGKSAGVSTIALLVAATFWSWLWGPIGLVLSVPLTVVLAVIGKQIPQFEALGILLGDEAALAPPITFYQRLLAGDAEEAADLLEEHLNSEGREATYDHLVIPALALAKRDRQQGQLDDADQSFVYQNARELVDENSPPEPAAGPHLICVAGCPAQDIADELALSMLQHLLPSNCGLLLTGARSMTSEKLADVESHAPDAVIISAVGAGGASRVRYLCKRLRQEHPRLRIIIGRWGFEGDREKLQKNLAARGADHVVTTLQEALDQIQRVQPLPVSA